MTPEPLADGVRVVVCLSGGIDSTTLVYDQLAAGAEVVGFGVDYGQRHVRELEAAKSICADLGIEYVVATVRAPFAGSELTDGRGGPVVPNRNMVLLSLAAATAISVGAQSVAIGCHAGDHRLFPDCRPVFLDAAWQTLKAGSGIGLLRPYVFKTKAEIVARAIELGVPFEKTWSCYAGGEQPCGICLACVEREKALGAHVFSLERTENPHPVMLAGAIKASEQGGAYWAGYLAAMADATGETTDALLDWMDRVG